MIGDKIAEALHYVSMLWNMQEQDIRGRHVLDIDALKMTNDKQQLFAEASEQLEEIIAELEKPEHKKVDAWISVNDKMPKLGDKVLVFIMDDGKYSVTVAGYESSNGMLPRFWYDGVTHWQPLPEAPHA